MKMEQFYDRFDKECMEIPIFRYYEPRNVLQRLMYSSNEDLVTIKDKMIKRAELYSELLLEEKDNLIKLIDENKLEDEFNIVKINKQDSTFSLEKEGQIINLIRYADQEISKAFKAEIISYKPVESYFITKPYNMGSLDYFKTIWSWTLTNDTGIPSELEVAYANNKIPFETMRTLAKISKDQLGMDFNELNFQKVDLQKNVVPRTYTTQRILSQLKFICFGFRNFNNTNSILSSMSIIYTIPYPSYGGD